VDTLYTLLVGVHAEVREWTRLAEPMQWKLTKVSD
jgi:hypothetical protein